MFANMKAIFFYSKDVASKSDPFCIVYAEDGEDMDQVCMTETIYDTHSCKWVQKVVLQATDKRVFKFDVSATT